MSLNDRHSPTYVLEHLATFTVSPENDLVYPADGMRRLLAMEKTNGIWTQKMLMKIDRKVVNIIDQENKEIVERFPLDLVREPTAFTSNDPKEMYNNILIYIVGHPPSPNPAHESPNASEMHIFQCSNVRARDVVEDIKSFMVGGGPGSAGTGSDVIKRYDRHSSPECPGSPYQESLESGGDHHRGRQPPPGGDRLQAQLDGDRRQRGQVQQQQDYDDDSSISSEKYERDVAVLNKCFDDIEKFIGRLQHAASAFQELEKRRRSRKSKKKDIGDGMLNMRAKPPPERDFVDIFQKFKLSFNLLAKLKAHIHDPNAPELVHFLFTPLALIVDASHDSHYGPNLPSKVLAPLLTADAVELLVNCLTSKENELWHSLGETWYVPQEDWKGHVPPYRPVFMDGYSPGGEGYGGREEVGGHDEVDYDEERPGSSSQYMHHQHHEGSPAGRRSVGRSAAAAAYPERVLKEELPGRTAASDDEDENSYEDYKNSEQRDWADSLLSRGYRVVRVTYPRTANNEKEMTVARGEFLEVLDDTRKWWRARNIVGVVGYVPHTIVAPFDPTNASHDSHGSGRRGGGGGKKPVAAGGGGEFRYF